MTNEDNKGKVKVAPEKNLSLSEMQQELHWALDLIRKHHMQNESVKIEGKECFSNSRNLLERCQVEKEKNYYKQKPVLRIIHHLACSGGTLISKCIAAQPNVFLLSELHPTTRLGFDSNNAQYTPRDVVTQAIYGRVPSVNLLAQKIFVKSIIEAEKHVRNLGGYLVIRAHSHSDYCINKSLPSIDTVTRILSPHFNIKQLVTVRNPIDSFLSLKENKWVHFKPESFDEYCRRFLVFINSFTSDCIIKYETFVADPEKTLCEISKTLELGKISKNTSYIDIFKISGDSGRKGIDITPRRRKDISSDFEKEISKSFHFGNIKHKLNYYS